MKIGVDIEEVGSSPSIIEIWREKGVLFLKDTEEMICFFGRLVLDMKKKGQ